MSASIKPAKQNLTLTIDRDVLKQARRYALEHDTSVNELVRSYLADLRNTEAQRKAAREKLIDLMEEGLGEATGERFNRDEIYERRSAGAS